MKIFVAYFLLFTTFEGQIPSPQVAHTLNQAYNNFWDGAVGAQGYWGDVAKKQPDVFSKKFDTNEIKGIYDMEDYGPYSSKLAPGGFDSFVPYYTPHGASSYNYVPTKSNFLSNQ